MIVAKLDCAWNRLPRHGGDDV